MAERRPWLDREGRLFGRIHVLDLAIVLLAALALVRLLGPRLSGASRDEALRALERPIEVTLLIAAEQPEVAETFKIGQTIKEARLNVPLGTIVGLDVEQADVVWVQPDGSRVQTRSPNRRDVRLVVRATGRVAPGIVTWGGLQVYVGQVVRVATQLALAEARVLAVTEAADSR